MKQLEVQIMGQSYLLGCPVGEEARFMVAVERVNAAMCKIRDAGKVKARDRIAVLAALNLSFDMDTVETVAPTVQAQKENDPQLTKLLTRLDEALGGDGQLI